MFRSYLKKEDKAAIRSKAERGSAAVSLLALLTVTTLFITGCGPGFPIMTSEQELLLKNVDTLMEDRTKLKDKVSAIEESGAAASELEETRISLADSKAEMGTIRDQLSFIRSSFEESELSIGQLKADLEAVNSKVDTASVRLAGIESSLNNAVERITSVSAASETESARSVELAATVDELKNRLNSLEQLVISNTKAQEELSKAPKQSKSSSAKSHKELPTPKYLYAKGLKETKAKEYRAAAKTFKDFLVNHSSHDLADNAQYWLGEIFYDTGEYERAILEFDKVITDYPKGDKRPAATLKQGFSFERLGAKKEARVLLETVIELYPKSEEATIAKKRLEKLKAK